MSTVVAQGYTDCGGSPVCVRRWISVHCWNERLQTCRFDSPVVKTAVRRKAPNVEPPSWSMSLVYSERLAGDGRYIAAAPWVQVAWCSSHTCGRKDDGLSVFLRERRRWVTLLRAAAAARLTCARLKRDYVQCREIVELIGLGTGMWVV